MLPVRVLALSTFAPRRPFGLVAALQALAALLRSSTMTRPWNSELPRSLLLADQDLAVHVDRVVGVDVADSSKSPLVTNWIFESFSGLNLPLPVSLMLPSAMTEIVV